MEDFHLREHLQGWQFCHPRLRDSARWRRRGRCSWKFWCSFRITQTPFVLNGLGHFYPHQKQARWSPILRLSLPSKKTSFSIPGTKNASHVWIIYEVVVPYLGALLRFVVFLYISSPPLSNLEVFIFYRLLDCHTTISHPSIHAAAAIPPQIILAAVTSRSVTRPNK